MVAPLFEPGVGLTGARLLFANGTIQHAGLAFYQKHLSHMFYKWPDSAPGPFSDLVINRECSGLTGACLALTRKVYEEVGGFSESLPINYNDVDFSFKIGAAGYRRVWVANARAYHFESQTREAVVHAWEFEIIRKRWVTPEQDVYLPTLGMAPRKRSKSA
jgi:GT2 family glycosyltransferase